MKLDVLELFCFWIGKKKKLTCGEERMRKNLLSAAVFCGKEHKRTEDGVSRASNAKTIEIKKLK